jgi:predicted nucleotidyltransferase
MSPQTDLTDAELRERLRRSAGGVPGLRALFLFGSRARGDASADADVDLGALFAHRPNLSELVLATATFEESSGRRVDLIDLAACSAFLALDAIRGERVFVSDDEACGEFELHVLRRAGDLEFFERERRRMLLTGGTAIAGESRGAR